MQTKYPEIDVQLTGSDGNAMMLIGKVSRVMRKAGVDNEEIKKFCAEAMNGDYDNVIQTCMKWINVI